MAITNFTTNGAIPIEIDKKALFNPQSKLVVEQQDTILDRDWLKQAFLSPDITLTDDADIVNRYWSSADSKFTDSRAGGNIGINARPQFTMYSDIRRPGKLTGRTKVSLTNTSGNHGMGRYYSEAIDDPAQIIYLRFGVQQFNSLTNFLRKSFDGSAITYNRTGRFPIMYKLGQAIGILTAVSVFGLIAVGILAGKVIYSFFERDTAKFYTIKPTMHQYWATVNTLVNALFINKGIFPKILGNDEEQKIGRPFKLDDEYLALLRNLIPDIINTQNGIDIYALANRGQRIANQLFHDNYEKYENSFSPTDFTGLVKKELTGDGSVAEKGVISSLGDAINRAFSFGDYYSTSQENEKMEVNPRLDPNKPDGNEKDKGWSSQFAKYFDAEFRDGSQFAIFRVDHTGTMSESFGNSTMESDLSQKLNAISSSARQARFTFADGNIAGGIGSVIQGAMGAVKDLALGALDGVTMGFSNLIPGLGGTGYIDIPKNWQSSSVNLPRSTYTTTFISPYGNPISQMQNIFIPLCMLLAGVLPRSTGKASYTNPYFCELYDRGRCQIKIGMIESLSIERGVSNLAYNLRGDALAIRVSFTVADLSSIMHMPTSTGGLFDIDTTLDEDNILSDYLAVLGGQDLYSQVYNLPRAKMKLAKTIAAANALTSPALWASKTSVFIKEYTFGIGNVIEAGVLDSSLTQTLGNRG